jgi:hypothetical protein
LASARAAFDWNKQYLNHQFMLNALLIKKNLESFEKTKITPLMKHGFHEECNIWIDESWISARFVSVGIYQVHFCKTLINNPPAPSTLSRF